MPSVTCDRRGSVVAVNPVERLSVFLVLFHLKRPNRKGLDLQAVPVSFLEPAAREIEEAEVLQLAFRSLRQSWQSEVNGPLSSQKIVDWTVIPAAQEWVVNSGPAQENRFVAENDYPYQYLKPSIN